MRDTASFSSGSNSSRRSSVRSLFGSASEIDPAGSDESWKNGMAMLETSVSNVFRVWENPCSLNAVINFRSSTFDVTVASVIFSRVNDKMALAVSSLAKAR